MKTLFLITFLYPMILFGQNEQVEGLLKLHDQYLETSNYDSIVINSKRLIELDRKIAKENYLDYYLAYAAFQTKNYELAVKQSKKVIPVFYHRIRTGKSINKSFRCQDLCFELADYYHETQNYKREYHNISLINRKYDFLKCGNGKLFWRKNLYNRMIDCSNKLGKTHRAKRLEKKLGKLNNE